MEKFLVEKTLDHLVRFLSEEELHVLDTLTHKELSTLHSESEYANQEQWYWSSIAPFWQYCPSPIRPSSEDIMLYRRFLEKKDEPKRILLLGSTPELRDLIASTAGARVYVADLSFRMLQDMLRFTRNVRASEETWLKCDWLDIPCPNGFFDVVIGDLALQQLPPGLEMLFLEKIHSLLDDNGVFVGRFQFFDDRIRLQSVRHIVEMITKRNLEKNTEVFLLHLYLLWRSADPVSRVLDRRAALNAFQDFLKQYSKKSDVFKNVHSLLLANTNSYRNWSPPLEEELMATLSSYFIIRDTQKAMDYPEAHYFPVLALEKILHTQK